MPLIATMRSKDSSSYADTKAPIHQGSRRSIFGLLVLSILCTCANVYIGHRRVNFFRLQQQFQYEENHQPPKRRKRKKKLKTVRDERIIHDGGDITSILRGEQPFRYEHERLKYKPGDLHMSSTEALQYCYVDTEHYKNHIKGGNGILVSASRRHKLIYRNIPKSSSSTARSAMEEYFRGEDTRMKYDQMMDKVINKNHTLISFVREPLNRFYSSYDEAFYRMGPWMGEGPIAKKKPMIAKNYHNSKHRVMDKYSYLYENLQTIKDYRSMYCPEEVLKLRNFALCNEVPSIDNGTLLERFERFVGDYNGLDPFDVHLGLQVVNLIDGRNGKPLPMSKLYNVSEAEKGWQELASQRDVTITTGGLKVARKASRKFDVAMVSNTTKQKICRLMALDYCCLNIKLPSICTEDQVGEDSAVYCALDRHVIDRGNTTEAKNAISELAIHTWDYQ